MTLAKPMPVQVKKANSAVEEHAMRRWAVLVAVCSVLCLLAAGASGEIYQWTDAKGQVHMTDDLSQVPASQRPGAERDVNESTPSRGWNNVVISPNSTGLPASAQPRWEPSARSGSRHVLGIQRAGNEIRLLATLNGSLAWPYVADTGASLNTIPRSAVDRLGLTIDADTPSTVVAGIGGVGMKVPVVTLRSVRIGSAVVENVEMAVLDTMSTGLLGMPFFNNFRVELDPARGTLVLEEIDINSIDGIYGGLDQIAWRTKFRQVRGQLSLVRAKLARMPEENVAQVSDLEEQEAYWDQQLNVLERKATRAGVPRRWRE